MNTSLLAAHQDRFSLHLGNNIKALPLVENYITDASLDAPTEAMTRDCCKTSKSEAMSPMIHTSKDIVIPRSNVLVVASHDEDHNHHPVSVNHCMTDEVDDDDDESVHSIERIMCPRAASFGQANKKRGGRWDTNLMEDSMPGLVSFSHGSFATECNGSAVLFCDDDSVSSLECSLMNSGHSRRQPNAVGEETGRSTTTLQGEKVLPQADRCKVLEPLAHSTESDGKHHQEVRWSGGALHRSSDTLPSVARRRT